MAETYHSLGYHVCWANIFQEMWFHSSVFFIKNSTLEQILYQNSFRKTNSYNEFHVKKKSYWYIKSPSAVTVPCLYQNMKIQYAFPFSLDPSNSDTLFSIS